MQNRRSYIDNLNAGRERRTSAPYDDIDRTLQGLEQRLDSLASGTARASYRETRNTPALPDRASVHPSRRDRAQASQKTLDDIARDIERARSGNRVTDMIGSLAGELKELKNGFRKEMASGLRKEFDVLRRDIEKTYVAAIGSNNGAEISDELDRISTTISGLSQRYDSSGVDTLRDEIADLKTVVDKLAREETLRAVDSRWGDMDRRFDLIEDRMAQSGGMADSEVLDRLYLQLQEIGAAIDTLPDTLPIRDLERRVQTLAEAIDALSARDEDALPPAAFTQIESRLDEISQAIATSASGSATAAAFDPEPLDRIEGRIAALADRLGDLQSQRDDELIVGRINALAEQVEALASAEQQPVALMDDRLHDRLSAIAERLDSTVPSDNSNVSAIEEKLNDLLAQFESSAPAVAAPAYDAGLEERLDDIVRRLEQAPPAQADFDQDIIRRMESHLATLSEQISGSAARSADGEHVAGAIELDRDAVLETARLAAIEAVKSVPQSETEGRVLNALTGDLKELEQLARRSEERNAKTFGAIHDTLLKIVDRLGALEAQRSAGDSDQSGRTANTPSLDDALGEPLDDQPREVPPVDDDNAAISPAAAAAAAAVMAGRPDDTGSDESDPAPRKGLGGLARAITRKKKGQKPVSEPVSTRDAEVQMSGADDEEEAGTDIQVSDEPLEPGSGAPDLSAIMKKVREARNDPSRPVDSKAAQADFIAAARRAAQAAAAEAEIMKKNSDAAEGKTSRSAKGLFKDKRKAILMGATAIMVLVAGYQLGTAFLGSKPPVISGNDAPAPAAMTGDAGGMAAAENQDVAVADGDAVSEPEPDAAQEPAMRVIDTLQPQADSAPADNSAMDASDTGAAITGEPMAVASAPEAEISEPALATVEDVAPQAQASMAEPSGSFDPPPQSIGPAPLREAAASGDKLAMFEIGARYAEARGVGQDLAKAALWYERAAEMGLAPAQYRIGNMYEKGTGIDRDIAAAKKWYQMAAQQGNASAMHNLAVLHAMGADGQVDNDSAARWFIEAAELGVTDSQFNLGILAAKGVGVPQNLVESYKWFALAGKAGDKDALKKRDEVANALRPDQLENARVATELWKVKPVDPDANSVTIPDAWTDGGAQTTAAVDMKKAIKNVQLLLIKNGFNPGTPDGIMGSKTTQAITQYQKANGMAATGTIDDALVRSLLEKNV